MPLDNPSPPASQKDALDRAGRLGFLRIDAATSERLRRLQPAVSAALPAIAEQFYAFLGKWPEPAALLGGHTRIVHLKQTQSEHWQHLFLGSFDEAYFDRAVTVGHAHERIGLEPRWYTGGYCLILEQLVAVLAANAGAKKGLADDIAAVLRAAFLDMDLAVSTYIQVGAANRMRREMLAVSDVLDREMTMAAAEIGAKAERLSDVAVQLAEVAEQVRAMAEAVNSSVETTAQNVQTVASATAELEASSREITGHVGRAASMTQDAVQQVSATGATVQELSAASGRIADVVGLVRTIAGQTKLLALNAAIEAARAGEAGRGFSVVASEVKSLARQTEDAIGNVNAQAQAIAGATTSATSMVEGIAGQVHAVHAIAADVSAATDQQREATAEIMRSVTLAAEHTQSVAERARDLLTQAETTDASVRQFRTLAKSVSTEINDLHRRLAVILRASQAGNRRSEEREPLATGFSLRTGSTSIAGHTADMSPHGALLVAQAPESMVGQQIAVTFDRIGRLTCSVRAVSPLGIHVQFIDVERSVADTIAAVLREARAFDRDYIARCQAIAAEVAQAFEQALAAGRIDDKALFDSTYREIKDTNPQQYVSNTTALCDALLPAIIDRAKGADGRVAFCCATDRNGYVATHNRDVSKAQRPGDPEWNAANSRNRRIFDDRTGILAARNMQPYLVQAYPRDLGGGRLVIVKEFDAPVVVRGRHWGALRLGITP